MPDDMTAQPEEFATAEAAIDADAAAGSEFDGDIDIERGQPATAAQSEVPAGGRITLLLITTSWRPFDHLLRSWPLHRRPEEVLVVVHQDAVGPPDIAGVVAHQMLGTPAEQGLMPWNERIERFADGARRDTWVHEVYAEAEDIIVREALLPTLVSALGEAGVDVREHRPLEAVSHALALRSAEAILAKARAQGRDAHVLSGLAAEVEHLRSRSGSAS